MTVFHVLEIVDAMVHTACYLVSAKLIAYWYATCW